MQCCTREGCPPLRLDKSGAMRPQSLAPSPCSANLSPSPAQRLGGSVTHIQQPPVQGLGCRRGAVTQLGCRCHCRGARYTPRAGALLYRSAGWGKRRCISPETFPLTFKAACSQRVLLQRRSASAIALDMPSPPRASPLGSLQFVLLLSTLCGLQPLYLSPLIPVRKLIPTPECCKNAPSTAHSCDFLVGCILRLAGVMLRASAEAN